MSRPVSVPGRECGADAVTWDSDPVETTQVPALVLAAGAGRRIGGPKALVRLDAGGPTLLERCVDRVRGGGCGDVTVVVGAAATDVAGLAAMLGVEAIPAPDWAEGMGASLRAGLTALRLREPGPTAVLVTLVDLPDVTAEVVARVLAAVRREPDPAGLLLRAAYGGRPGHPAVIGARHWATVLGAARGDVGAREVLASPQAILVECGDLASGDDLDRPDQLDRWRSEQP